VTDDRRHATPGADAMRALGDQETGSVAGWTIFRVVTLVTILGGLACSLSG
jgi:hypothetical protein